MTVLYVPRSGCAHESLPDPDKYPHRTIARCECGELFKRTACFTIYEGVIWAHMGRLAIRRARRAGKIGAA